MSCYINSKICFDVFRSVKVSGLDLILNRQCVHCLNSRNSEGSRHLKILFEDQGSIFNVPLKNANRQWQLFASSMGNLSKASCFLLCRLYSIHRERFFVCYFILLFNFIIYTFALFT